MLKMNKKQLKKMSKKCPACQGFLVSSAVQHVKGFFLFFPRAYIHSLKAVGVVLKMVDMLDSVKHVQGFTETFRLNLVDGWKNG